MTFVYDFVIKMLMLPCLILYEEELIFLIYTHKHVKQLHLLATDAREKDAKLIFMFKALNKIYNYFKIF